MLSLEWLERASLELGALASLVEPAGLESSEPLRLPFSEVERVVIVSAVPDGVVPVSEAPGWFLGERALFHLADDELSARSALERLMFCRADASCRVEIDPLLRPSSLATQGEVIAESWLALDGEPMTVLLASRSLSFACLSPYPEDLGATLHALARSSAELRPNETWTRVLDEPPTREIASVIAEHVLRVRPALRDERRSAERSVGLELSDRALVTYGRFTSMPAPCVDPTLKTMIPAGARVQLVASRSPLLLQGILRPLLEAERIAKLGVVFEDAAATSPVFTADSFALPDDAFAHHGAEAVRNAAAQIDLAVDSQGPWIGDGGEWGVPIRSLRLTRRASVRAPAHAEIPACFVGHRAWDLRRDDPREASTPLHAFRIALGATFRGLTPVASVSTRLAYRERTRRG